MINFLVERSVHDDTSGDTMRRNMILETWEIIIIKKSIPVIGHGGP
jgi:hypothetical protein